MENTQTNNDNKDNIIYPSSRSFAPCILMNEKEITPANSSIVSSISQPNNTIFQNNKELFDNNEANMEETWNLAILSISLSITV